MGKDYIKKDQEKKGSDSLIVLVRFGKLVNSEYFTTNDKSIKINDSLLISTDRGTEIGIAISTPVEKSSEIEKVYGKVLRHSRESEREALLTIQEKKDSECFKICAKICLDLGLEMKLQMAESIFGGERLIFYFTAYLATCPIS